MQEDGRPPPTKSRSYLKTENVFTFLVLLSWAAASSEDIARRRAKTQTSTKIKAQDCNQFVFNQYTVEMKNESSSQRVRTAVSPKTAAVIFTTVQIRTKGESVAANRQLFALDDCGTCAQGIN